MATATMTRTDEQIQRDVVSELKWDARIQPNEVGVAVKDGVVTLLGLVDSYYKKSAAEDAAHHVRGVTAVADDIEVRLPSAAERSDTDIAMAATRAIEWDSFVPIENLDITVVKGWIRLAGHVEWQSQKEEAERVIRRLSGVRGVTNQISIKPRVSPSDLEEKIQDALVRSAELDADRITVEVMGSKVILKGTVRSWAERQDAGKTVSSAPGVTFVDNRITVST